MFRLIFSGRVSSHPEALNAQSKTSSQVESENSRSTIVTIHSRRTNSETSVITRRQSVKKRTTTFSVKTNRSRDTGGTHVWMKDTHRWRVSSDHPGVRSRIQSAIDFIALLGPGENGRIYTEGKGQQEWGTLS
jgi:hypothetical protein